MLFYTPRWRRTKETTHKMASSEVQPVMVARDSGVRYGESLCPWLRTNFTS